MKAASSLVTSARVTGFNQIAQPPEEFRTSDHPEKSAAGNVRLAHDRRAKPRYKLAASIELVNPESGARVKASLRDLSVGGCHAHTNTPFPDGTEIMVHITKGKESFEAKARVVSSIASKGINLKFTHMAPGQLEVLDKLIAAAMEASWTASNRRKSQRILMRTPVSVSGYEESGASFKENTYTISISPLGALIFILSSVKMGQRLVLLNKQTKAFVECTVVHKGDRQAEGLEIGVQFATPSPTFWSVTFPPVDWSPQHPDSKFRT
jgi:hypothetical protein